MRFQMHAVSGLILGATLILLAGCGQDEASMPAVHNEDLGARQGEVLVPYEPAVNRSCKLLNDASQYPMPAMPATITAEATATQPGAAEATAGQPGTAVDEYSALARQVVDDLSKGAYDKVFARFDAGLKTKMPLDRLQTMWNMTANQAGAFQSQEPAIRQQAQGQELAIVPCKFEKGPMDVVIAFNPNKEITDLSQMPPQMRAMVTAMAANMPGPDSIFAEPAPGTPEPPASPEAVDMAKEVAGQLTKGDVAAVEARLTDGAKAKLKQPLADKWQSVSKDMGPFKQLGQAKGSKVDKNGQSFNAAAIPIEFEKGMTICMVAFDTDKKIAELWLIPMNAGDLGQAMQGAMQGAMQNAMPGADAAGSQPASEAPASPAVPDVSTPAPATPAAGSPAPAVSPAAPARPTPGRPAAGRPGAAAGNRQPAAPVQTPRSAAGFSGGGMGELPPTAPAPVGLGN